MKKFILFVLLCVGAGVAPVRGQDVFLIPDQEEDEEEDGRTAAQILHDCTRVIPTDPMVLKGALTVRRQRGTVLAEYAYSLLMDWGAEPPSAECLLYEKDAVTLLERALLSRPKGRPAQIRLFEGAGMREAQAPAFSARIRGTDMTWLDLTLDFLWWKDVRFDEVPRGKCRTGRVCHILLAAPPEDIPGCSAVRVWVDARLSCVMQAEQLDAGGKPVRKMWVQNVKKMNDRWMIRDMEIETLNSGHRTRLFVDDAAEP